LAASAAVAATIEPRFGIQGKAHGLKSLSLHTPPRSPFIIDFEFAADVEITS
jgi:hypothetical protein